MKILSKCNFEREIICFDETISFCGKLVSKIKFCAIQIGVPNVIFLQALSLVVNK